MTRPLPPLGCDKHPHAIRMGAECGGCWAERNAKELDRSSAISVRRANPHRGGWVPVTPLQAPRAGKEWP